MKKMRMKRKILLFQIVCLYAVVCYAQKPASIPPTLCKKSEVILATCGNNKTKKIMSICASPKKKNEDFNFIEYRFGALEKLELIQRFNRDTQHDMPLYRGLGTNYNVYYGFLRRDYYYVVSIPQDLPDAFISIWVTNVKTKEQKTIECNKGLDYWDGEKKLTSTQLVKEVDGDKILISEDGLPR